MKKSFALLLACLMLCPCLALAEGAPGPLTKEEVDAYLSELGPLVAAMPDLEIIENGDGTSVVEFPGGSIIIEGAEMSADARVLNARVETYALPGLRVNVGATLSEVLAAYPNDNDSLFGSYYEATLYVSGEKPEVSLGYVFRDGQRAEDVVHDTFFWGENSAHVCDVTYHMEDNMVCYMVVDSAFWEQDPEELDGLVADSARMQEVNEYFAYPSSENGETLAPLEREDLSFRTLIAEAYENAIFDFIDLNYVPQLEEFGDPYDQMIDVFGMPQVDEWTEDSTGEKLRILQWDGVSLVLVYDAQKNFLHVDSLTVNKNVCEGPRGVRIGDLMDAVLFRFRHVEEFRDDGTVLLYGDGVDYPYGRMTYSPGSAEVVYALAVGQDAHVLWSLTFIDGRLETMTMLLR